MKLLTNFPGKPLFYQKNYFGWQTFVFITNVFETIPLMSHSFSILLYFSFLSPIFKGWVDVFKIGFVGGIALIMGDGFLGVGFKQGDDVYLS